MPSVRLAWHGIHLLRHLPAPLPAKQSPACLLRPAPRSQVFYELHAANIHAHHRALRQGTPR